MTIKRRVFYSFHYKPDNWRAAQVRNIGVVDGNRPATDNDWETVKRGGDATIKLWISNEMRGKSCTVVLVGSNTAGRKWINHEIVESWDRGMGVVGIRIHGLKALGGHESNIGGNPFDCIKLGDSGKCLSAIVRCYNPAGATSKDRYAWISDNLSEKVEEAIRIRERF